MVDLLADFPQDRSERRGGHHEDERAIGLSSSTNVLFTRRAKKLRRVLLCATLSLTALLRVPFPRAGAAPASREFQTLCPSGMHVPATPLFQLGHRPLTN
jgi:hypothetical protein